MIFQLYAHDSMEPVFQIYTQAAWQVMTDSRVKKTLSAINLVLGLPKNFYPYHAFQCSGATLAYKAHGSIREIQEHGTWTSECIWRYIQTDPIKGSKVALAMKDMLL